MRLASIQTITDIRPIPDADRIQAATVLGFQTVIKRGEFAPGELCVWHEPDTVVAERPEYEFLRKQEFRLKVSRFKGQVSQGLALPLNVLPEGNYNVGTDVTELIGIKKYEKPIPATLAGVAKGAFPSWISKTDEPNLRSYPDALPEFTGRACVITRKVDGTSATYFLRNDEFGVCSRNLELLDDGRSMFWRIARQYRIEEALRSLKGDFALQGEIYGENIQGNHARIQGISFATFNLFDIGTYRYMAHEQLTSFCKATDIPAVPVLWNGTFDFTLEELVRLANGQEYVKGSPAEGIVIRPVGEEISRVLPNGRLSAKVLSERYALKHGE